MERLYLTVQKVTIEEHLTPVLKKKPGIGETIATQRYVAQGIREVVEEIKK